MMQNGHIQLTQADIESLPHYKKRTGKEWSSACPVCGDGNDRFRFWPDTGNFWCRRCDVKGFIGTADNHKLSPDVLAEIEANKRSQAEQEAARRKIILNTLQKQRNDLAYHQRLMQDDYHVEEMRIRWGLMPDTVKNYYIGYSAACPTSPYSDSYTIPFYHDSQLINIRHRLISPNGNGKYRPEVAGLNTSLFSADLLSAKWERIFIFEGEFKTIFMAQHSFLGVGLSGMTQFQDDWVKLFHNVRTVYVCLDPDAEAKAVEITERLNRSGNNSRMITLPTKPDDFFHLHRGTTSDFEHFVNNARKV